jgi:hypothetical protein
LDGVFNSFNPLDIVGGIEPDIVGHEARQLMWMCIQRPNPHALAAQIRDGVDAVVGDQFEASEMDASQYLDRCAGLDGRDVHRGHVHIEIRVPAREPLRVIHAGVTLHVVDICDTVGAQQFSGEEDGCPAVRAPLA